MVDKHLVPPAVLSEAAPREGGMSYESAARRLVDCVIEKVKLSPDRYEQVVTILGHHEWLSDVVEILTSAHRKHYIALSLCLYQNGYSINYCFTDSIILLTSQCTYTHAPITDYTTLYQGRVDLLKAGSCLLYTSDAADE